MWVPTGHFYGNEVTDLFAHGGPNQPCQGPKSYSDIIRKQIKRTHNLWG